MVTKKQSKLMEDYEFEGGFSICVTKNRKKDTALKERNDWIKKKQALGLKTVKKTFSKYLIGYGKTKCYSGKAYSQLIEPD